MRKSIVFTAAVMLIGVIAAQADLVTITNKVKETAYGMSGVNANTVYSSAVSVQVAARGGNSDRKGWMKWEIGDQLEEGQRFNNAQIQLTFNQLIGAASGDVTFSVYGIVDSDDNWQRSSLTWNNAPKNVTTSSLQVSSIGTVNLGSFTINTSTIVRDNKIIFSSSALDDYINWGSGMLGDFYETGVTSKDGLTFIIAAAPGTLGTAAGAEFYSSTATGGDGHRPAEIIMNVIPEPATLSLFVVSGLGAIALRHRFNSL